MLLWTEQPLPETVSVPICTSTLGGEESQNKGEIYLIIPILTEENICENDRIILGEYNGRRKESAACVFHMHYSTIVIFGEFQKDT